MLQPNYTEKASKLFTGRNSYIEQIEKVLTKNNIVALLANSGFGHTTLLKQISKKIGAFYLDLNRLNISPENFAVDLIGSVCYLNFAKNQSTMEDYNTIEKLKQLKLDKNCRDILNKVDNELQKIKPDQELLLKSAFAFPEELAAETDKKFTIILNNFNELLKLNNFLQIKDAPSIFFNSIEKNKHSSFIIASASVFSMKKVLKQLLPNIIEMSSFSFKETKKLFEKISGNTDDRIIKEVHTLSAGIPPIIKDMARRFKDEKISNTQENIKLVKYILCSELATTSSRSYFYCSKLFSDSLSRARGESLLKTIIKTMSNNQPLRLTEVARRIYRSSPVTKSLLERLVEVDMITKTDNTFDFTNPVLKQWCKLMFSNIEFDEIPDEKTLTEAGGLQ